MTIGLSLRHVESRVCSGLTRLAHWGEADEATAATTPSVYTKILLDRKDLVYTGKRALVIAYKLKTALGQLHVVRSCPLEHAPIALEDKRNAVGPCVCWLSTSQRSSYGCQKFPRRNGHGSLADLGSNRKSHRSPTSSHVDSGSRLNDECCCRCSLCTIPGRTN